MKSFFEVRPIFDWIEKIESHIMLNSISLVKQKELEIIIKDKEITKEKIMEALKGMKYSISR